MPASIQNTVILAKIETTAGTDAAPTNTADAILVRISNLKAKIDELMANRDIIRGVLAAPDQLPYTRRGALSFSVDLASSGAAGTAPAWGKLLQACGFAETITAATRVDYTPISSSIKTLTIWAYINNKLEKFNYCMGNVKLKLDNGIVPTLDFDFQGLVSSVAQSAPPTPTLTPWIRPLAIGAANTGALTLGGTYATGAITGGTGYNFSKLMFDLANDVQDLELSSTEQVGIFGRNSSGSFTADLGGTAIATQYANMHAGTTVSVGVTHGTAAGNKIIVFAPQGVITNIDDAANGNILTNQVDFALQPSTLTASDELRIVAL